jgi:hypothetical protein
MTPKSQEPEKPDMLPEYDFRGGVRGKHHRAYSNGHTVKVHREDGSVSVQHYALEDGAIMLAPDVREYFSDSDSVNEALRALIKVAPRKRKPAQRCPVRRVRA